MHQPCRGLTLRGYGSSTDRGGLSLPGEGTTALRGALLEEFDSELGFVAGEAVRWPLRVAHADHSRLEYHGVAAGGVVAALTGGFELLCGAR